MKPPPMAKAYLCRALAKQGQLEAARKNFTEARPYLEATGENELMTDCEQALAARQALSATR
jgi:hypothetical protein